MIEFIKSYACSDGNVFATLKCAQEHELVLLLTPEIEAILAAGAPNVPPIAAARAITKHADKVVDILTTTAKSRPKARRAHGGRKPRKKRVDPIFQDVGPDSVWPTTGERDA